MSKLAFVSIAFALVAVSFYGCDETKLTEPSVTNDESAADVAENTPGQAPLLGQENGAAALPFWTTGGNANTNPSSQFLGTVDNQSLLFKTNGQPRLTILGGNGQVGIGTVGPQAPLHVVNGVAQPELIVQETRAGQASHIVLRNPTRSWWVTSDASPDEFQISGPSGGLRPFTILGSNGNIGIGTDDPQAALHVKRGAHFNEMRLEEPNVGAAVTLEMKNSSRTWTLFADADPDYLQIAGAGPGGVVTILGGSGYFGIGTSSPQSKLHVSGGDIRVTGGSFIDDGTTLNVPDYVFEEPYTLMSLAELREFIRQEGHLPNVPSADDVRRDGLNLSQFQMKLLEKVEELTLYALAQDEQIQALSTLVAELGNRPTAEVQ